MRTATKTATAPAKGRRPDFSGVPGEIVSLDVIPNLTFGGLKRTSPYDALLNQLAQATDTAPVGSPRPGLKFADPKAKASVYGRAKKLGLRVSFAEAGGALYVRMEGRLDDATRASRNAAIKRILVAGPLSHTQITNKLRDAGDITIDAPTVDLMMLALMKAGDVIRQEGGAWKLAPKKPA